MGCCFTCDHGQQIKGSYFLVPSTGEAATNMLHQVSDPLSLAQKGGEKPEEGQRRTTNVVTS